MSRKTEIQEDIRDRTKDIEQKESRIKTLKEDLQEKIDNTEAGERVGRLRDQLKIAQEDLVSELKRDGDVNNLMEEIAAEKDVLKGMRMALSDDLIAYFAQTKERQVQMDEQGHARDVLMTAKLGKEEKQYQESIFSELDKLGEVTVEKGGVTVNMDKKGKKS